MIKLSNITQAHRHGARLRKRVRVLRPVRPSKAVEVWYRGQLLALVARITGAVRAELLTVLASIPASDGLTRDDMRAMWPSAIPDMLAAIARRFGGLQTQARQMATMAAEKSLRDQDQRLKQSIKDSVKIDIGGVFGKTESIRTAMEVAIEANVVLITSIPVQHFERLEKRLIQAVQTGIRHEALAKELYAVEDITKNRAKLIARDQVSKMNSAFSRIRQTSLGIKSYTWQTAGDERVRDEHNEYDGKEYQWDDPPPDGHPGEAIQCRCVALPIFNLDDDE